MATAQEQAAELQQSISLLSPQEREALGYDTGTTTAEEAAIIDEAQNNGNTERQPITEDDLPPVNDQNGGKNDMGSGDGDEGEVETDEEREAREAEEAAAAQAAADAAAEAAKNEPAAGATADPAPTAAQAEEAGVDVPYVYVPPPVPDYDNVVAGLHAQRREAHAKFIAGELDDNEYAEIDQRSLTELMDVSNRQSRHVQAEEQRVAVAEQAWMRDVNYVKAQAKKDGLDYDNPEMNATWDLTVKMLAANPKNEAKPPRWFLTEAHRLTKLQYNLPDAQSTTPPPATQQTADKGKKSLPRSRTPDLSQIPPTLRKAPAAASESEAADGGEFSYIDSLQGIAQEQAIARLSPEQAERYLAS